VAKQGILVARRRDGWLSKVYWWPGGEMGDWVAKQGICVARERDGGLNKEGGWQSRGVSKRDQWVSSGMMPKYGRQVVK
jgi:hypothetical protein